jgi:hypothetical protein
MKQAEQTDQNDSENGPHLPDEIKRRQKLREKMQQARAHLEAQAKARAESEQSEYERKLAEREQRPRNGGGAKAKPPNPPKDTPDDKEQTTLTDPDSRLMRKSRRSAFTQSYNAQAVVDAEGSMLILGGPVTQCAADTNELVPALETVPAEVGIVTAAPTI